MNFSGLEKLIDGFVYGTAAAVGLVSLGGQLLGPNWNAAIAAGVVYIVGCILSRSFIPRARLMVMAAAAIAAYIGAYAFEQIGGISGALFGIVVTTGLSVILIPSSLLWYGRLFGSKRR
jgi:cobalamin synthase